MAKNTSISLSDHLSGVVERQVAQGRFGSVSEVVWAGLRLLEEHKTRLKTLRLALVEGERSGPAEAFDFDEFLKQRRAHQPR